MSRKTKSTVRESDAARRAERLDFRLDSRTKRLIERAAELEGRTVTEFCLTALAETARRTLELRDTLVLSATDLQVFFDVLMSPPTASERLERAFDTARRRVATGPGHPRRKPPASEFR